MTWLYFSRKKSKVSEMFQEFKALVENQTSKKIKVLRTDNKGEFYGKEFDQFYSVEIYIALEAIFLCN